MKRVVFAATALAVLSAGARAALERPIPPSGLARGEPKLVSLEHRRASARKSH